MKCSDCKKNKVCSFLVVGDEVEETCDRYEDKQKIKLLELFSGYGTASFALKQLGIPCECVGYSDIDKYANQCFQQNHGGKELGDCTKIDPNDLEDFDLLTGGFPCQTFSVAGKHMGELDTRGTLFNEIIRIAEVKKPRYMMLENVKGLMSKRHKSTFDKIISELYRIGYFVKWKVLNTKEHGIPQNRERVFFVCCKSWTDFCNYEWAEKEELKILLKDVLEEDVDEKYYLKDYTVNRLLNNGAGFRSKIDPEVGSCLFASMHKVARGMDLIKVACNVSGGPWDKRHESSRRVYDINAISPTIPTADGGGITPKIFLPIKNATKKGYLEGYPNDGINLEHPDSKTRRGRIQKDVIGCLQINDQRGVITEDFRIRKLTPTECFRLQGFLNDEVNLEGLSNTQRYKLAGNGQSVNVVKKIFYSLFLNNPSKVYYVDGNGNECRIPKKESQDE